MPRRESKKDDSESLQRRTQQKYVVPECKIHDLVGSLSVLEVGAVAARFQVVADLTSGAFEERIDQLTESDLILIKRIADEGDGREYRELMTAIIDGVGRGRHGINAAHLTARRFVELAFRCTREYFSALNNYRRNLRLKLVERSSRTASVGRRPRNW